MSAEEKVQAVEEIETAISRFYTVQRAAQLALRNSIAGTVSLDPSLKQLLYITFLNVREELGQIIDDHISDSAKVGPLISSKVMDIYAQCLHSIRAYEFGPSFNISNMLKNATEYEAPLLQAKEVADLSLVSEEFLEEISATSESMPISDEGEEFP
jgi:hypothetical protein